jgi:DNA-binding transcriptional LysR family regulator
MALRSALLPALAAFAAAARHQNFAHAADELHLTASAVSHHVRKLEATLDVVLFQRHARGVTLTTEGRLLADAAGSALAEVEAVLDGLRRSRSQDRVRISALPSLATTWLMPRLGRFAAAHPGILLGIDSDRAPARFDDNGPDLGIRYGPGQWPGLSARYLMDDALFPVAAPKLARGIESAAQIMRLPLVTDAAPEGWREWFRAAGIRGMPLSDMHGINDSAEGLAAAVAGLGAVLARKRLVGSHLADGRLQRLPGPELPARFAYYVVHAEHRRLKPSAATFIAWLEREAQASDTTAAPRRQRARGAR